MKSWCWSSVMSLEGMVAMDTELFLMNSRIMYILHVSIHMAQSKVKSKWNSIYCLPVVAIDNLRQVQGSYEAGVDLCHVEPLQTFHYGRHSATDGSHWCRSPYFSWAPVWYIPLWITWESQIAEGICWNWPWIFQSLLYTGLQHSDRYALCATCFFVH